MLTASIFLKKRTPKIADNILNQARDLIFTKHAICRMDCRKISRKEVFHILSQGSLNPRKSDPNNTPCPTQAWEGKSLDGPKVRVVKAHCKNLDKIITVIDLDNEYNCHCP